MGNGAKRKRERERERVLYDRVRGMRKTQKVEPCVFPREEEGMDEKSTGRINSKMNLVKVKVLNEVRYQCSPLSSSPLAKCAAATLFSRSKG